MSVMPSLLLPCLVTLVTTWCQLLRPYIQWSDYSETLQMGKRQVRDTYTDFASKDNLIENISVCESEQKCAKVCESEQKCVKVSLVCESMQKYAYCQEGVLIAN